MWPAQFATIRHCPPAANFSEFLPREYPPTLATSRPGWYQRWYHNDSSCRLVAATSHPKFGGGGFAIIRHCPLMPDSSGFLRCQVSPIFASVRPRWCQGWCQRTEFDQSQTGRGRVELLATRSSAFVAVHYDLVFRRFLHPGSRRCPWCVAGVGVSIGVSCASLSHGGHARGISDAASSCCCA
jgi:hypothetical protein